MHSQNDDLYSMFLPEGIGQLVLNRPASHNAISREMWLAIPGHLQALRDQGASIVVIRGGGKSFAAGADIMELKELQNYDDAKQNWQAIAGTLDYLNNFELPTIAAIDGPCMGGGCLLACACDLRYASKRSSFSVPVARLGIALDDANLGRLACLVGVARAKELIYRGRVINATEAKSWGLLNEVFSAEEFAKELEVVLSEITANSALSIKEAKASFARFMAFTSDPDIQDRVVKSYLHADFRQRIQRALNKE